MEGIQAGYEFIVNTTYFVKIETKVCCVAVAKIHSSIFNMSSGDSYFIKYSADLRVLLNIDIMFFEASAHVNFRKFKLS